MKFQNMSIDQCQAGDILASDVYHLNGKNLLIKKDVILNEYMKKYLMRQGVRKLCVYQNSVSENCEVTEAFISTIIKNKESLS